MIRHGVFLTIVALLTGGSVACSSDSKTAATTTQRTVTQTTERIESQAPPPPPAKPPTLGKRHRVYQELARARDRGISGPTVYREVAQHERIGVDSVVLIEHEGSLRRWPLPAAPKLPPSAVRARTSPVAATRLRSSVGCNSNAPRTGIAHLRWRPARRAGTRQWVAVTIYLKGFALGSFEASGPLSPRVSSFEWHRIHGQAIHLWRVITRDRSGNWLGSVTARFTGPTCVAEFEP